MLKRSSKRYRPEDGGCPAPVDADLDFNAKTREFITLCERTSLDLQETRARHKVTMELVEQRNKELEAQKTEHAAAMEAEYDATQRLIDERDELTVSHNAVVEEFRTFKARDTGEADKFRRLAEQLTAKCEELREQNERLAEDAHNGREQNERLAEEVRNEHNGALKLEVDKEKLVTERDKLKGAIKAAQETFHDCITLQNRPGVLLTSGQMLDLEGIVSLWLNSPRFNGDIWFPFQCPLTYRTTTPVHELSEFIRIFCILLAALTHRTRSHARLHRPHGTEPQPVDPTGALLPAQGGPARLRAPRELADLHAARAAADLQQARPRLPAPRHWGIIIICHLHSTSDLTPHPPLGRRIHSRGQARPHPLGPRQAASREWGDFGLRVCRHAQRHLLRGQPGRRPPALRPARRVDGGRAPPLCILQLRVSGAPC
jgi:hypothetical protein